MINIFFIAIGGALGSILRYVLSNYIQFYIKSPFPFATISVNIIGSFLIGICYYLSKNNDFYNNFFSENLKLFLIIGIFGGFTTFSTFSLDFFKLMEQEQFLLAAGYVFLSVFLSLIAVFAGYFIVKQII
ncbi:fluoride efflux transporter CrcB [Rickettsiales bacterium]|nr:fluoride efflux transporter CrcB [Rickettsiales bacterium]MDB2550812.1 fluoride efflux transporter CrcB [Rickettsiales bacterium]